MLATQTYRDNSDLLRDFLADRCILDPSERVSVAAIWQDYVEWALRNSEPNSLKRVEFTRRLEALGLQKERSGHAREWTWFGISLRRGFQESDVQVGTEPPPTPNSPDVRADADKHFQ
jgi:hypothetical protein